MRPGGREAASAFEQAPFGNVSGYGYGYAGHNGARRREPEPARGPPRAAAAGSSPGYAPYYAPPPPSAAHESMPPRYEHPRGYGHDRKAGGTGEAGEARATVAGGLGASHYGPGPWAGLNPYEARAHAVAGPGTQYGPGPWAYSSPGEEGKEAAAGPGVGKHASGSGAGTDEAVAAGEDRYGHVARPAQPQAYAAGYGYGYPPDYPPGYQPGYGYGDAYGEDGYGYGYGYGHPGAYGPPAGYGPPTGYGPPPAYDYGSGYGHGHDDGCGYGYDAYPPGPHVSRHRTADGGAGAGRRHHKHDGGSASSDGASSVDSAHGQASDSRSAAAARSGGAGSASADTVDGGDCSSGHHRPPLPSPFVGSKRSRQERVAELTAATSGSAAASKVAHHHHKANTAARRLSGDAAAGFTASQGHAASSARSLHPPARICSRLRCDSVLWPGGAAGVVVGGTHPSLPGKILVDIAVEDPHHRVVPTPPQGHLLLATLKKSPSLSSMASSEAARNILAGYGASGDVLLLAEEDFDTVTGSKTALARRSQSVIRIWYCTRCGRRFRGDSWARAHFLESIGIKTRTKRKGGLATSLHPRSLRRPSSRDDDDDSADEDDSDSESDSGASGTEAADSEESSSSDDVESDKESSSSSESSDDSDESYYGSDSKARSRRRQQAHRSSLAASVTSRKKSKSANCSRSGPAAKRARREYHAGDHDGPQGRQINARISRREPVHASDGSELGGASALYAHRQLCPGRPDRILLDMQKLLEPEEGIMNWPLYSFKPPPNHLLLAPFDLEPRARALSTAKHKGADSSGSSNSGGGSSAESDEPLTRDRVPLLTYSCTNSSQLREWLCKLCGRVTKADNNARKHAGLRCPVSARAAAASDEKDTHASGRARGTSSIETSNSEEARAEGTSQWHGHVSGNSDEGPEAAQASSAASGASDSNSAYIAGSRIMYEDRKWLLVSAADAAVGLNDGRLKGSLGESMLLLAPYKRRVSAADASSSAHSSAAAAPASLSKYEPAWGHATLSNSDHRVWWCCDCCKVVKADRHAAAHLATQGHLRKRM